MVLKSAFGVGGGVSSLDLATLPFKSWTRFFEDRSHSVINEKNLFTPLEDDVGSLQNRLVCNKKRDSTVFFIDFVLRVCLFWLIRSLQIVLEQLYSSI